MTSARLVADQDTLGALHKVGADQGGVAVEIDVLEPVEQSLKIARTSMRARCVLRQQWPLNRVPNL